jgi:hypothetical protein
MSGVGGWSQTEKKPPSKTQNGGRRSHPAGSRDWCPLRTVLYRRIEERLERKNGSIERRGVEHAGGALALPGGVAVLRYRLFEGLPTLESRPFRPRADAERCAPSPVGWAEGWRPFGPAIGPIGTTGDSEWTRGPAPRGGAEAQPLKFGSSSFRISWRERFMSTPNSLKTFPATPSCSRNRPNRMCSVPM